VFCGTAAKVAGHIGPTPAPQFADALGLWICQTDWMQVATLSQLCTGFLPYSQARLFGTHACPAAGNWFGHGDGGPLSTHPAPHPPLPLPPLLPPFPPLLLAPLLPPLLLAPPLLPLLPPFPPLLLAPLLPPFPPLLLPPCPPSSPGPVVNVAPPQATVSPATDATSAHRDRLMLRS
jgi:hypothetical protein